MSEDGCTLSDGYNGFPRGMADTDDRLLDRPWKLRHTIHAEVNCIFNAGRVGTRLQGSTMYVFGLPMCENCALGAVQAGVKRVVQCYPVPVNEQWALSSQRAYETLTECGVGVATYDVEALDAE